jgi:hypothetical protein
MSYNCFVGRFYAIGREDILKLTIGDESLQEISNDSGARVVNFSTSKKYNCQKEQCSHIATFINILTWS